VTAGPAGPSTFVALRQRNFRLLWLGQLVSMSGTMMQGAAILWHISLLAPPGWKALSLGLVGLARIGPILVFGLWSGVLADVVDRRRLMLIAQTVMMLAATMLAVLTASGRASAWAILVVAGAGAAAGAADGPARQSLLPSLVPREHLPNAISLNSILFQTASVIGPAIAGVALATLGVAAVYALNAVSFLGTITALLLMRDLPATRAASRGAISLRSLGEGLRFVFGTPLLRSTLLLDGIATFFCSATALLPLFAQDVLQVGPRGYGWLYAAPSIGAVVASASMIRFAGQIRRRGVVLVCAVGLYGAATVGFGLSRTFWPMFLALAVTGSADTVSAVLRNIVRQLETPDHLRGRMVGISMLFFMGGPQLGEFESGVVAQWLGAGLAVVAGGIASLVSTGLIAWRSPALRAYRRES
jgi:MFS family permease